MKIKSKLISVALLVVSVFPMIDVLADGATPVASGAVIRGVELKGNPGSPGSPTKRMCDFSKEDVNQAKKMTGASVNCLPGGNIKQVLVGLPERFNAYCIIQSAPVKSARLIQASVPGNNNHCDLSGISRKDATKKFKGAVWR